MHPYHFLTWPEAFLRVGVYACFSYLAATVINILRPPPL